jgi:hypothetical protein
LEKIEWLIAKLQRQQQAGASATDMLATLQLLQLELSLEMNNSQNESKSVTVVMPSPKWNMHASDELATYEVENLHSADEEKVVFELEPFVHVAEPTDSEPGPITVVPSEIHSNYIPAKKTAIAPAIAEESSEPKKDISTPAVTEQPAKPPVVLPSVEAVEMKNPTIQADQRSLNDLLEKPADELFNKLHEPIKDLKKAISINDRFQYITNLFSNDEAMYDRSIKTINNFNVFSEAEYWIRRELAVKHGWRENDPLVKEFYWLVSRRFS